MICTEFSQNISSGNALSELGSIETPLTTNGSTQYLDHLSIKLFANPNWQLIVIHKSSLVLVAC